MRTSMGYNMNIKYAFLFCLFYFVYFSAYPSVGDSIKVSLLTCSPGEKSFELFGHTGIRVQGPEKDMDIVFHYGVFNFNAPHFIYRFTKGETDYSIGTTSFRNFVLSYAVRNSGVMEQELNLTADEKEDLLQALVVNNLPQNRIYRYNFLFDNCATRPRDIVERCIRGKIDYIAPEGHTTFREMIHKCTFNFPWLTFGIDLALGAPLDKPVSYREEMFLPSVLMEAFGNAQVISTPQDSIRPLVTKSYIVVPDSHKGMDNSVSYNPYTTPMACGIYFLVAILILSTLEIWKKQHFKWLDCIIFSFYGIVGCVICFLVFISEHPATSPNYSIIWANPLQLLIGVFVWVKYLKKVVSYYHFVNFAVLLLFLIVWHWLPQLLNIAFIPYIIVLIVRSLTYIGVDKRLRNI